MYSILSKVCEGSKIVGFNLINEGVNEQVYKEIEDVILLAEDGWVRGVKVREVRGEKKLESDGIKLRELEVVRLNSSKKEDIDLCKIVKRTKVEAKNFKIIGFDINSAGVISAEFITQVRFKVGDNREEVDAFINHIKAVKEKNGTCIVKVKESKGEVAVDFRWSSPGWIAQIIKAIMLGGNIKANLERKIGLESVIKHYKRLGDCSGSCIKVMSYKPNKNRRIMDCNIPYGYTRQLGYDVVTKGVEYIDKEVAKYIAEIIK